MMNLQQAKEFLFDELGFKFRSQAKYFPEKNMRSIDIWNVIDNYFLDWNEETFLKLIEFIKENKEVMIKKD